MSADRLSPVVDPVLVGIGLRRRAKRLFSLEVGDGIVGTVSLNTATEHERKGVVLVHPVLGIHHHGIEQIVASLIGQPVSAYKPGTVSSPLADHVSDQRAVAWRIDPAGGPEARSVTADLAAQLERLGLAWLRSVDSLAAVRARLAEGCGFRDHLALRIPVAMWLDGDPSGAQAALDRLVAAQAGAEHLYAHMVRCYAEGLRTLMDSSGDPLGAK